MKKLSWWFRLVSILFVRVVQKTVPKQAAGQLSPDGL